MISPTHSTWKKTGADLASNFQVIIFIFIVINSSFTPSVTTRNSNSRINLVYLMESCCNRELMSLREACTDDEYGIKLLNFFIFPRIQLQESTDDGRPHGSGNLSCCDGGDWWWWRWWHGSQINTCFLTCMRSLANQHHFLLKKGKKIRNHVKSLGIESLGFIWGSEL